MADGDSDGETADQFHDLRDALAAADKRVLETLAELGGRADTTEMREALDGFDGDQLRYRRKKLVDHDLLWTRPAEGEYPGSPPTVFHFTDRGEAFVAAGVSKQPEPYAVLDGEGPVLEDDADRRDLVRAFRAFYTRHQQHAETTDERLNALSALLGDLQARVSELEEDSSSGFL